MATTIQPPAPAPATPRPQPHRWTVTEFNRMGDMGWFEGKGAFLLDGTILEQGSMDPPHAIALELTEIAVRVAFGTGWRVRVQMPFHIDQHNDPLPDLLVVGGNPRDILAHPTTASLVVEVSSSTLDTDLTEKAERYATAGVGDYWILDVNARQLHVMRDPQALPAGLGATAYRTHLTLAPTDRVSPLAVPTASILVSDLLP